MEDSKSLKDLARNPLGIVALFISLIYGFASLLLGASAEKLGEAERWPIIIFIVVFPFAVLAVFYRLVTNHHGKLYSPSDYKDDNSFLRTLSPEEKAKKLENEAKEVTGDIFIESPKTTSPKDLSSAKQKIKKAETNVISLIETELGIKPDIDIQISPEKYTFDAAYIIPSKSATILEVKYYSRPRITANTVSEFIYRAKLAADYMTIDTNFILALVVDGEPDSYDFIVKVWTEQLIRSGLKAEVRVIKWSSLSA